MSAFVTLIIILCNQYFSYEWHHYVKSVGLDNLLTHMVFFALIELATIWLIVRVSVQGLTDYLQTILLLGIITHFHGAFWWVRDNDSGLMLYDSAKAVIFYLELMGFFIYGATRLSQGRRAMAFPAGVDNLSSLPGSHKNTVLD